MDMNLEIKIQVNKSDIPIDESEELFSPFCLILKKIRLSEKMISFAFTIPCSEKEEPQEKGFIAEAVFSFPDSANTEKVAEIIGEELIWIVPDKQTKVSLHYQGEWIRISRDVLPGELKDKITGDLEIQKREIEKRKSRRMLDRHLTAGGGIVIGK